MVRTRLEKSKPINLYSLGKESNRIKTHRKTENGMGRCNEEGRGRTRRRSGGSDWKARAADREGWKAGCMMIPS